MINVKNTRFRVGDIVFWPVMSRDFRIKSFSGSKATIVSDLSGPFYAEEDDLSQVELDGGRLSEAGFLRSDGKSKGSRYSFHIEEVGADVSWDETDNRLRFVRNKSNILSLTCDYVDQLQNALRLFGFDEYIKI